MTIDWRAFLQTSINRLIPIILTSGATYFATKWAAGAEVLKALNSGQTVSLWHGTVNLSISSIEFYAFTGSVTLVSIVTGWYNRVKLKRNANIALKLPPGATPANIQEVAAASPTFSSQADPSTLTQVARSIPR